MKVTVSPITTPTVRPFPKLMKSTTGNGLVVLKQSDRLGFVVAVGRSTWKIGEHHNQWSLDFEDFTGTVTLEND